MITDKELLLAQSDEITRLIADRDRWKERCEAAEKIKSIDEIIYDYLKSIGADGLCNLDYECGCGLEDGLFPCESAIPECVPAKLIKCKTCKTSGQCEYQSEYAADECYFAMENSDIVGGR